MKKYGKLFAVLAVLLVFLLIPLFGIKKYYMHILISALISVIAAQGLNVILGLTGYCSIAHSAFFGMGAYTSALLAVKLGINPWACILFGVAAAVLVGVIIGVPSLKTHGTYFVIITLAFATIFYMLLISLYTLTGGESGMRGIPSLPGFFGIDFSDRNTFYYFALLFAVLATFICYRIKNSRYGRALLTIKANEQLAQAMGIPTTKYKLSAFLISSGFAGFAGTLFAFYANFLSPSTFSTAMSMNMTLALILGGVGSISGPIVGAFLMEFLPELLRVADEWRMVIYGLFLILIIIFMPLGIVNLVKRAYQWTLGLFASMNKKQRAE